MAAEVVTDPLRTALFKLELFVLVLATLHTSYFTVILLKVKTFPLNLKILCLYLGVLVLCNVATRIWIIVSFLWVPALQERLNEIQVIHGASLNYFEIDIIWIIFERILFIQRMEKSTVIPQKIVSFCCCFFVIFFHLLISYLNFSNIVIGIRITYFVMSTNLICLAGFLLLNKLNRNYYRKTRSADLNIRYKLVQSVRISRTMIYLSFYSLIPFSISTAYMLTASYYWKPNNLLSDFAIASNFIDLEMAVCSVLYPLVFSVTHPEVNRKFFSFFTKQRNCVHPVTKPSLRTTLDGRNLIVDNRSEGQLYFEQLKNQWN